jgi:energy-coupling factor transporter ATP-binding protein EcfA2
MDIDKGHACLNEMLQGNEEKDLSDANEATTRKLIIDKILEGCLGWIAGEDIKYNERVSEDGQTTFCDYILTTATTSIVIEAKRLGKTFKLPTDKTSGVLGGVLSVGDVGDAIRQARDYARKLSIQFAVATNGSSWVMFPAVRTDQIAFEESRATIFKSLADIKERFVEFWEVLSRQRVMEGGLESAFFGSTRDIIPRRLVSTLPEPGYRVGRNRIYEYIEPAVTAALTDEALLEDVEGLERCYVKNSERAKFDSRIRMHLKDIKPMLDRTVTRPRSGGDMQKLDKILDKIEIKVPRFILVLGPVGAGKTTFLQYTRKVSAYSLIEGKVIWFDIDFKKATEGDDPKVFIFDQLNQLIEEDKTFSLNSWERSIKPAYRDFIEARQAGTLAPLYRTAQEDFERRVAESIEAERIQIVPFVERVVKNAAKFHPVYLVIDNVDQIENEDYQRRVFIEAQGIDPPSMRPVLSRRLNYAKKVLSGVSTHIRSESGASIDVPDLGVFFEIVSGSLLSDQSGYLIEVLAGSDIRRGLEFVREFLASGHVSADHALITYLTSGSYHFPRHEIFA